MSLRTGGTLRKTMIGMTCIALAGCAFLQRGGDSSATRATEAAPAAAAEQRVYYADVDGLKVYSQPSFSSNVVGTLSLHEKVLRSKLERGFAYVTSAQNATKGWVNNARLIWRLPSAPTNGSAAPEEEPATAPQAEEPPAPAEEPPAEEPGEPQAPAAQEAQEPAGEPSPDTTAEPRVAAEEIPPTPTSTPPPVFPPPTRTAPRGVAPSIFNPY